MASDGAVPDFRKKSSGDFRALECDRRAFVLVRVAPRAP